MRKKNRSTDFACPVEATVAAIGGKWKPPILHFLQQRRVVRFGELRRHLPEVTQQMLTNQLRELERDGLIHREVYRQVPPKVEYSLTELGESFQPVLTAMCQWGQVYQEWLLASEPKPMKIRKVLAAR